MKDRTVLVTGGTKGIGRAIVERLVQEGARVVVMARDISDSQESAGLAYVQVDVAQRDAVIQAVETVRRRIDHIDVLITSAGTLSMAPFHEMSPHDFQRDMDVNFYGVVNVVRAVLPDMLARGRGKVINIASGAGERGWGGASAYAASKAAVIGFSKSLAEECKGKGVSVNVISPAMVDTGLLRGIVGDEFVDNNAQNIFTAQEIAGAALFIASDMCGRLNGQVLSVRNSARW